MGKAVYLGSIRIYWCDECNVPLIGKRCGICGKEGRKLKITPPGEMRIGFEEEAKILKNAIKEQFSCDLNFNLVYFNRIPHYDRMDEVILDGEVIGNLRFENGKFLFTLRMEGAYLINKQAKKGWVIADSGAIKPILEGKNLMVPGVLDFSEGIKKGDEIIVRDENGKVFAVGIAKMSGDDMRREKRGVAVKIRYRGYGEWREKRESTIEDVLRANIPYLKKLEEKGIKFIKEMKEKFNLPLAVSFSGGKDSLVTLLLAMESGLDFHTFFLDTGIELPETVEYVREIGKKYGIKIDYVRAEDAFWRNLEHFGPPGRDYRWCCKVCKLGPTTRYIIKNYPHGLLTLIGQRRYESFEREKKGEIWKNEWVPNQISISPIQNWNSLEIWLYILWKRAMINPWYKRGLTRIGCYLCPSSDLADFEIVRRYFNGIEGWFSYLKDYAKRKNIDEKWTLSSWRWKEPPEWAGGIKVEREKLRIEFEGGEWKKAKFNKNIDINTAKNLLFALPEGTWKVEDEIYVHKDFLNQAKSLLIRSQECIGCGICLGRCPTEALRMDDGKVEIEEEKCIHCLYCLGKCPAEEF